MVLSTSFGYYFYFRPFIGTCYTSFSSFNTLCREIPIGPTNSYSITFSFWFPAGSLWLCLRIRNRGTFLEHTLTLTISAPSPSTQFQGIQENPAFLKSCFPNTFIYAHHSFLLRDNGLWEKEKRKLKGRTRITVSCHISLQKQGTQILCMVKWRWEKKWKQSGK